MSAIIIGLTGGIASGKSAVAARFARLGAFICDADQAAREAVAPGSDGLTEVIKAFGPGILQPDGHLDRAAMRHRIFSDAAAKKTLEAILHPRVRTFMQAACQKADAAYTLAVIPLLAETGRDAYRWLHRVLVIDTPLELQRTRLLARDGIDADLVQKILSAQASRAQRRALADDILVNDGALDALDAPILNLNARYRKLANG